jgi:hypothetical protein
MAMDTVRMLRRARPMSRASRRTLAALLDFGAALNARLDDKNGSPAEFVATRALLEDAGLNVAVADYAHRLEWLETNRPQPGDDAELSGAVRDYRESVVRLSLGMVALAGGLENSLDEAIDSTSRDLELNVLFRIVMLCQILDDVADYPIDCHAGLPSFLTASRSLEKSLAFTRLAAREYGTLPIDSRRAAWPLRFALRTMQHCCVMAIGLRQTIELLHRRDRRGGNVAGKAIIGPAVESRYL